MSFRNPSVNQHKSIIQEMELLVTYGQILLLFVGYIGQKRVVCSIQFYSVGEIFRRKVKIFFARKQF
jgi:hypothetical protein